MIMTLNERNKRLQDLRNKLAWHRVAIMALEQDIRDVRQEYKDTLLFGDDTLEDLMFQSVTEG